MSKEETIYCKTIGSGVYEYISLDDDFIQYRNTRKKDYIDIYLEEHLVIAEKLK